MIGLLPWLGLMVACGCLGATPARAGLPSAKGLIREAKSQAGEK